MVEKPSEQKQRWTTMALGWFREKFTRRPSDNVTVDWRLINEYQKEFNHQDLASRREVIEKSPMKEFLRGEILGMHIFEGRIGIRDFRKPERPVIPCTIRLILGRDIPLPTSVHSQHSGYSDLNNTVLATAAFNAISMANNGRIVLEGVLGELVDLCKRIDGPLTILYAHGDVEGGVHIAASGMAEMYPTEMVLTELAKQLPSMPSKEDRPTILLCACGTQDDNIGKESNPYFVIGYPVGQIDGKIGHMYPTSLKKIE